MKPDLSLGIATTCFIGALLFASSQPFFAFGCLVFGIGVLGARKFGGSYEQA
jgi:hypothetical protein